MAQKTTRAPSTKFSNAPLNPVPSKKTTAPSSPSEEATSTEPSNHTDSTPRSSLPVPAPSAHSTAPPPNSSLKKANSTPDRGEVLDQILPRPASSALASIQGTVRVTVRVHVDPAGNVSQALIEQAGPSKYFAQKSLEAAKGWVFLSPSVDGHSAASEWLIRFDFSSSGTNAFPKQVSP